MSEDRDETGDAVRGSAQRWAFTALACFCIPLGLLTRQSALVAPWLGNHLGGVLYVLWWCFLAHALLPRARPAVVATAVLAATCGVELAQLWHPPLLEALRATLPGRLVLGATFSWADFPAYVLGAALAWLTASRISGR